jgi:hypothetical protein
MNENKQELTPEEKRKRYSDNWTIMAKKKELLKKQKAEAYATDYRFIVHK